MVTTEPAINRWLDRRVRSGHADPRQLVANPANWRAHPDNQRQAFGAAATRVGWLRGILLQVGTDLIIDGHMRVGEAVRNGEASVPCDWLDLTDDEVAYALAILDPLGTMATKDEELFARAIEAAQFTEHDSHMAALFGLSQPDMSKTEHVPAIGMDDATIDDEVSVPQKAGIVQFGDIWMLGDHFLMCGDSCIQTHLDKLMMGETADIVCTDPPYNVAYQVNMTKEEAKKRHRRTDGLEIQNDNLSDADLETFLYDLFVGMSYILKPGGAFYVCSPPGETELDFRLALRKAGLQLRESIIWAKDRFVMGRQDYHWRHESILYGWRDGAAHYFVDDRTQDTVWEIKRPGNSKDHPTQKPVELVERVLKNSSRFGELVVDLCAGSGTTILAAERTSRRARAMEKDPRYAEATLRRWKRLTGIDPMRIEDGAYLEELDGERRDEDDAGAE